MNNILALYSVGLSLSDISCTTGRSKLSIVRTLSRYSDDFKLDIIDKYKSGINSIIIANDMGISETSICRILKNNNVNIRLGIENKRILSINEDYFSDIDTESKAYWLGFLYADGCIRSKRNDICLCLHEKDSDILHKLASEIYNSEYSLSRYKKSISLHLYSDKIKKDLIRHGCGSNKTFFIRVPELRDDLMRHFLRGVFDGDGCYYIGKSISISLTGNKDFVKDIYDYFVKNIAVGGCICALKRNNNVASVYWKSKKDMQNIINYLYIDSNIYLDRKYIKSREILHAIY